MLIKICTDDDQNYLSANVAKVSPSGCPMELRVSLAIHLFFEQIFECSMCQAQGLCPHGSLQFREGRGIHQMITKRTETLQLLTICISVNGNLKWEYFT